MREINEKQAVARSQLRCSTALRGRVATVVHKASLASSAFAALLLASGCGPSSNGGAGRTSDAQAEAQQQVLFSDPRFASPILMHILADDSASAQTLAAQTGPMSWWPFVQSGIGCVQQGYAANGGVHPVPTIDNYPIDGRGLESHLEQGGLRSMQTYSLSLIDTPWGPISRSFECLVNSDAMASLAGGQNLHGDLAIPIADRVCTRWSYVNQYQTAMPGQGTVQMFAGTFAYEMVPRVDGFSFQGQGSASVKMYLNPDNGQWVVMSVELHDPNLTASVITGTTRPAPSRGACAGL